jgi:predicted peroxiredoxin
LVAVGAAEQGRDTLIFLTKEAVRLVLEGVTTGVARESCPPLATLVERYAAAGGPICFESKSLEQGALIPGAELGGTVPLWERIGDDHAVTFSY